MKSLNLVRYLHRQEYIRRIVWEKQKMRATGLLASAVSVALLGGAINIANAAQIDPSPCAALTGTEVGDFTQNGESAFVDGAKLVTEEHPDFPTGSGVIDSFVRIGSDTGGESKKCVQGYNTSGRDVQFDEKSDLTFTHDLLLANVPVFVMKVGGVDTAFYQFRLDINQDKGKGNLLSIENIEIWQSGTEKLLGFTPGSGFDAQPSGNNEFVWSLDESADRFITLDYDLYGSGSGRGDFSLYVPTTKFSNLSYVYLFTRFGDHSENTDGYEEWYTLRLRGSSFCPPGSEFFPTCLPTEEDVPEPGTLALLGLGLVGLAAARRRERAAIRN